MRELTEEEKAKRSWGAYDHIRLVVYQCGRPACNHVWSVDAWSILDNNAKIMNQFCPKCSIVQLQEAKQ